MHEKFMLKGFSLFFFEKKNQKTLGIGFYRNKISFCREQKVKRQKAPFVSKKVRTNVRNFLLTFLQKS